MNSPLKQRGYLLIEVLISAAIVAMVLATAVLSFQGVTQGFKRAEFVDNQIREAQSVAARLRVGSAESLDEYHQFWVIDTQPEQRDNLAVYKISHRQDPGFSFVVEVFHWNP